MVFIITKVSQDMSRRILGVWPDHGATVFAAKVAAKVLGAYEDEYIVVHRWEGPTCECVWRSDVCDPDDNDNDDPVPPQR